MTVCAGGAKPRDYQDERFSYVVLQRGERPEVPAGAYLTSPDAVPAAAPQLDEESGEELEAGSTPEVR